MIDLPHFYATHRDRLRKHLPETFRVEGHHFELNEPSVDASFGLTDDIVSIFLEHAARRVLLIEGLVYFHRSWQGKWSLQWAAPDAMPKEYVNARGHATSELDGLAAAMDTLFPPSQEPHK